MTYKSTVWILSLILLLAACESENSWKALPAGTEIAKKMSPNSLYSASVFAGELKGEYMVHINEAATGILVSNSQISAPIGYHQHLITLIWEPSGKSIDVKIDHDFGERNVVHKIKVGK